MARVACGHSWAPCAHPAAVGFLWLFFSTWCTAPAGGIQVTVSDPYHVVILFQPVTLPCTYQMSSTLPEPIVIWKYKSFCRDRVADAFSPASVDNQINAQLAAGNPGYNPYVECQDSVRTVRVVATKQGNAVTLGDYYQGRRITITGNADLTFEQTSWGDSGVYYCSVVSAQDLQGNNEAYAELIVLDWLFVVVVCLAAFLVFLLLGICWCQCCPHTCCCYVRCPCCPEKCCCPEALYAAGKAATSGVPSIYAPSTYAHLSPTKTPPPPPAMIPMGPVYNGYPGGYAGEFDRNSSVGHSSQVPLLRDTDSNMTSAMSEVTSLHEDDWRSRPSRGPALTPIRDEEWGRHSPRSPRRWEQEPPTERPGGGWGGRRPRAHSVDALDDLTRPGSAESGRRSPPSSGRRGRAYAPPRSRSRDDLYDPDDSRDFPHSRDPHYDDFRSRDRPQVDPRSRQHRSRDSRDEGSRSGDPHYDERLLEEALRKKGPGERRKHYREEEEEEEAYYPPPPPPYSETDSQASRERRLKKVSEWSSPRLDPAQAPLLSPCPVYTLLSPLQNLALSRESLVV
ncbi:lipolysis-stimulated lipoprotein receptor isoform X5 [Marmota flaviventris]|uniref:lipolysis-stimulated lipoprotein receptor isoform X5 n=1 Tax=Marmota flaviventris TaxID=93162 RepID=UPI003A8548D3